MTLNPDEVQLYHKEYPMFAQFEQRWGALFLPRNINDEEDREERIDLMSKIYILMKRLKQSRDTLMRMPQSELDFYFDIEYKLMKEEEKQKSKDVSNNLDKM